METYESNESHECKEFQQFKNLEDEDESGYESECGGDPVSYADDDDDGGGDVESGRDKEDEGRRCGYNERVNY